MHSLFNLSRKYEAFQTHFSGCLAFRICAPTYFQSMPKGLRHKMEAEALHLSSCKVQPLQNSPEINNFFSTEYYSVIHNFPYTKAHRVACQPEVAERCLREEAGGICCRDDCSCTCCDAGLDGFGYQTRMPKPGEMQVTKEALLFIENVKIM